MHWIRRPVVLVVAVASLAGLSACTEPPVEGCTRDVLRATAAAYYDALARHDPSTLSWSPTAKLTENGALVTAGQGLWQTAGTPSFTRFAYDTDTCGVHSQVVMNDGDRPAIVGVRFKMAAGESGLVITESETYTTHSGDYFFFSPEGVSAADAARPDTQWEAAVPEAQRSTRQALIDLADNYFSMFGSSIDRTPYQTNCDRWENGVRTSGGDCAVGIPAGTGDGKNNFITHRRYPFVDVENGVVVGYVLFGGYLDFHMMKVVDGQVRLVSALVGTPGHTSSGWD